MMDARRPCPDSALLAAFLDGTLSEYERTAVVSHLVECPECRAVAVTVVEFREVEALDSMWEREPAAAPAQPVYSSEVTRWARLKTRAPAMALALGLATLAMASYFYIDRLIPSWSAQRAVSTLIDAAELQRPVEGRLSGAVAHAPPPSSASTASGEERARLVAAATNVRHAYSNDHRVPSRRAVGVAALLTGDLDEAIATLEIAASGAPDDTGILNDLAAAYFERAQRAHRPDDLPAALSAVERVLYRDPTKLEALFNRALIISALGLRAEASTAWQAYIARDGASPWGTEAAERRQALTRPVRSDWDSVRETFEHHPGEQQARVAVREHTTASHDYVEHVLLERWVAAANARDTGTAETALAWMRLFADAFAQQLHDHFHRDVVAAIARADSRGPAAYASAVSAHQAFATGMSLMREQNYAAAGVVLARAQRELALHGSPLAVRAQIEQATVDYYSLRYLSAHRELPPLRGLAVKKGYRMLAGRAAWIQGLAAFGLNDFGAARAAYEEMLSSATASGDVDQWLWACGLLANLHFMLGDSASAWRYRIDAARRSDEAFARSTSDSLLASAAGDAAARGYHSTALLFQSFALSNPARTSANLEVQLRSQRARSLHALGRRLEAEREVTLAAPRLAAVADGDRRLSVEADLLTAEAEVFRETDHARAIAAAQRALTLPVRQSDLRRARMYLTLGEALLEDGQLLRAADAVASGIEMFEAYRAQAAVEFTLGASDGLWDLYRRAAQIAMRRGDVGRAFAYNERGRVRTPQERRTWGARTASLDDLQRVLPTNTALTVLTQFGDRLQIWVVRRDDVISQAVSMTPSRAAGLIAAHLREMVQQTPSPGATAELYSALFAPIAPALAGIENVVVVADAPYNRIAFAGLWDRQSNHYVVERHGIVLAPSATAYQWALNKALPRSGTDTVRRASVLRPGTEHPTRVDAVVTELRAAYGSERTEQLEALTASRFVDAVARGDVIHIEGTLVPNDEFPSLSSIRVDEEPGHRYSGAVFARSFADTSTQAKLVTLETSHPSASSSLGEGALGFARVLIAAGVPAVVSPVTAVAEASVEQTWLEFHRRYAAGETAAASLRRAQIDALNDSDRRPGPWATLTVFGSAQ